MSDMTRKIATIAALFVLFCIPAAVVAHAQTYNVVSNFNPAYGENPLGPLVQGIDGNLYGVTETGGKTNSICPGPGGNIGSGCGSVFKVTPSGQLSTIYEFCSLTNCTDGAVPIGSLVLTSAGNLLGATSLGGSNNQGTVFEITPVGRLTTLYSFCSQANCADGTVPNGGLVQGINGNFYGTTVFGGANQSSICVNSADSAPGCGTVFEITAKGRFTTLYSFCSAASCADGDLPSAGLTLGNDGNFYGTTYGGGILNQICVPPGCGTAFRVTPVGQLTTLHYFCSRNYCNDGENPQISLVRAANGEFYGMAPPTVFEMTSSGKLTVVHRGVRGGVTAAEGLMQATDGNLYGTSLQGKYDNCSEASACGSIFEVQTSGELSTLYNFCAGGWGNPCLDGAFPLAGLMQATSGTLYGTAFFGGTGSTQGCNAHGNVGCGVVFSGSLNLGPFVQTVFNFAKPGGVVGILGNDLTGTTSVTFNGTPATFKVRSSTYLLATVPAGATTGSIEVTTPSGTISSNVAFHVIR